LHACRIEQRCTANAHQLACLQTTTEPAAVLIHLFG
jgi:hypothetical protein